MDIKKRVAFTGQPFFRNNITENLFYEDHSLSINEVIVNYKRIEVNTRRECGAVELHLLNAGAELLVIYESHNFASRNVVYLQRYDCKFR